MLENITTVEGKNLRGLNVFPLCNHPFYAKLTLSVCRTKSYILFLLTIEHRSGQSSSRV